MTWALLTLALVGLGGGFLFSTVRAISGARDETWHYRLSIRFWAGLALAGMVMVGLLARPMVGHSAWLASDAGRLTLVLMSVLPGVVIFVGLRNTVSLWRALRRRERALARGARLGGRVVSRARRLFAQDLMSVVVEADVPAPEPSRELGYRARDRDGARRHRFVETCPSDHWDRFAPGTEVRLSVDLHRPASFAVLLFGE